MIPFIPPKRSRNTAVVSRKHEKRGQTSKPNSSPFSSEGIRESWRRMQKVEERESSFSFSPYSTPYGNSPCLSPCKTPSLGHSPSSYAPVPNSSDGVVSVSTDRLEVQGPSCGLHVTLQPPSSLEKRREGIPSDYCSLNSSIPSFSCDPTTLFYNTHTEELIPNISGVPPIPLPRLRPASASSCSTSQLSFFDPTSFPANAILPNRVCKKEEVHRAHPPESLSFSSVSPSSSWSSFSPSPPVSFPLIPQASYSARLQHDDQGISSRSFAPMGRSVASPLLWASPPWQQHRHHRYPRSEGHAPSTLAPNHSGENDGGSGRKVGKKGRKEAPAHSSAVDYSKEKQTERILLHLIQALDTVIYSAGTGEMLQVRPALRRIVGDLEAISPPPSSSMRGGNEVSSGGSHSLALSSPRVTVLGLPHSGKGLVLSFMMRETCDLIIPPLPADKLSTSFSPSFLSKLKATDCGKPRYPPQPVSSTYYTTSGATSQGNHGGFEEMKGDNNISCLPCSRFTHTSTGPACGFCPPSSSLVPTQESMSKKDDQNVFCCKYNPKGETTALHDKQIMRSEKLKDSLSLEQRSNDEGKERELKAEKGIEEQNEKNKGDGEKKMSLSLPSDEPKEKVVQYISDFSLADLQRGNEESQSTSTKQIEQEEKNLLSVEAERKSSENDESEGAIVKMSSPPFLCPFPPSRPHVSASSTTDVSPTHPPPSFAEIRKRSTLKHPLNVSLVDNTEKRLFDLPNSLERSRYPIFGNQGKAYPIPVSLRLPLKAEAQKDKIFHNKSPMEFDVKGKNSAVTTTAATCGDYCYSSINEPSSRVIRRMLVSLKKICNPEEREEKNEVQTISPSVIPCTTTYNTESAFPSIHVSPCKNSTGKAAKEDDTKLLHGLPNSFLEMKETKELREQENKKGKPLTSLTAAIRKEGENGRSKEKLYVLPRGGAMSEAEKIHGLAHRSDKVHIVSLSPYLLSDVSGRRKFITPLSSSLPFLTTGTPTSHPFQVSSSSIEREKEPLENEAQSAPYSMVAFPQSSTLVSYYSAKERKKGSQQRQKQFLSCCFSSSPGGRYQTSTPVGVFISSDNICNYSHNVSEVKKSTPLLPDAISSLPSAFPPFSTNGSEKSHIGDAIEEKKNIRSEIASHTSPYTSTCASCLSSTELPHHTPSPPLYMPFSRGLSRRAMIKDTKDEATLAEESEGPTKTLLCPCSSTVKGEDGAQRESSSVKNSPKCAIVLSTSTTTDVIYGTSPEPARGFSTGKKMQSRKVEDRGYDHAKERGQLELSSPIPKGMLPALRRIPTLGETGALRGEAKPVVKQRGAPRDEEERRRSVESGNRSRSRVIKSSKSKLLPLPSCSFQASRRQGSFRDSSSGSSTYSSEHCAATGPRCKKEANGKWKPSEVVFSLFRHAFSNKEADSYYQVEENSALRKESCQSISKIESKPPKLTPINDEGGQEERILDNRTSLPPSEIPSVLVPARRSKELAFPSTSLLSTTLKPPPSPSVLSYQTVGGVGTSFNTHPGPSLLPAIIQQQSVNSGAEEVDYSPTGKSFSSSPSPSSLEKELSKVNGANVFAAMKERLVEKANPPLLSCISHSLKGKPFNLTSSLNSCNIPPPSSSTLSAWGKENVVNFGPYFPSVVSMESRVRPDPLFPSFSAKQKNNFNNSTCTSGTACMGAKASKPLSGLSSCAPLYSIEDRREKKLKNEIEGESRQERMHSQHMNENHQPTVDVAAHGAHDHREERVGKKKEEKRTNPTHSSVLSFDSKGAMHSLSGETVVKLEAAPDVVERSSDYEEMVESGADALPYSFLPSFQEMDHFLPLIPEEEANRYWISFCRFLEFFPSCLPSELSRATTSAPIISWASSEDTPLCELQYFDGIPVMHLLWFSFSYPFKETTDINENGKGEKSDLATPGEGSGALYPVVKCCPSLLESTIWECIKDVLPPPSQLSTINRCRGENEQCLFLSCCINCMSSFIPPFRSSSSFPCHPSSASCSVWGSKQDQSSGFPFSPFTPSTVVDGKKIEQIVCPISQVRNEDRRGNMTPTMPPHSENSTLVLSMMEKGGYGRSSIQSLSIPSKKMSISGTTSLSDSHQAKGSDSLERPSWWNNTNTNSTVDIGPNGFSSTTALFVSCSSLQHNSNHNRVSPHLSISTFSNDRKDQKGASKLNSNCKGDSQTNEALERNHNADAKHEFSEEAIREVYESSSPPTCTSNARLLSSEGSPFTISENKNLNTMGSFLATNGTGPSVPKGVKEKIPIDYMVSPRDASNGQVMPTDPAAVLYYCSPTWRVLESENWAMHAPKSNDGDGRIYNRKIKSAPSPNEGNGTKVLMAPCTLPLPTMPSTRLDFSSSPAPSFPSIHEVGGDVTQQEHKGMQEFLSVSTLMSSPYSAEDPHYLSPSSFSGSLPLSFGSVKGPPTVESDVLVLCIREEDVYHQSPDVLEASLALLFGPFGKTTVPTDGLKHGSADASHSSTSHSPSISTSPKEKALGASRSKKISISEAAFASMESDSKYAAEHHHTDHYFDYIYAHSKHCKDKNMCGSLSLKVNQIKTFHKESKEENGASSTTAPQGMRDSIPQDETSAPSVLLNESREKECHAKEETDKKIKTSREEKGEARLSPLQPQRMNGNCLAPLQTITADGVVRSISSNRAPRRYTGSRTSSVEGSSNEPCFFPGNIEEQRETEITLRFPSPPPLPPFSPCFSPSHRDSSSKTPLHLHTAAVSSASKSVEKNSAASTTSPQSSSSDGIPKNPTVSLHASRVDAYRAIRQALSFQTLFVITKFSNADENNGQNRNKKEGKNHTEMEELINAPTSISVPSKKHNKLSDSSSTILSLSSSGTSFTSTCNTSCHTVQESETNKPSSLLAQNYDQPAFLSDEKRFFACHAGEAAGTTCERLLSAQGTKSKISSGNQSATTMQKPSSLTSSAVVSCHNQREQEAPLHSTFPPSDNPETYVPSYSACFSVEVAEYAECERNEEKRGKNKVDVLNQLSTPPVRSRLPSLKKTVVSPLQCHMPSPILESPPVSQKSRKRRREKNQERKKFEKHYHRCTSSFHYSSSLPTSSQLSLSPSPTEAKQEELISSSLPKNSENPFSFRLNTPFVKPSSPKLERKVRKHFPSCPHYLSLNKHTSKECQSIRHHSNRKRSTLTPESLLLSPTSIARSSFNSSLSSSSSACESESEGIDLHSAANVIHEVGSASHPTARRFQSLMKDRYGITVHEWQIICPFHPLQCQLARDVLSAFFVHQLHQQLQQTDSQAVPSKSAPKEGGKQEDVSIQCTPIGSPAGTVPVLHADEKGEVKKKGDTCGGDSSKITEEVSKEALFAKEGEGGNTSREVKVQGNCPGSKKSSLSGFPSSFPAQPTCDSMGRSLASFFPARFPFFVVPHPQTDGKKISLSFPFQCPERITDNKRGAIDSNSGGAINIPSSPALGIDFPYSSSSFSALSKNYWSWCNSLSSDPTTVLKMVAQTYMNWVLKKQKKGNTRKRNKIKEIKKERDKTKKEFHLDTQCDNEKVGRRCRPSTDQGGVSAPCSFSTTSTARQSSEEVIHIPNGKTDISSSHQLHMVVQHARNILWPSSGASSIVFLVRWAQHQAASYRLSHCATSLISFALFLRQKLPKAAIKWENVLQMQRESLLQKQATLQRLQQLSEALGDCFSPIFGFTSGVAMIFEKIQSGFCHYTQRFLRAIRASVVQQLYNDVCTKRRSKNANQRKRRSVIHRRNNSKKIIRKKMEHDPIEPKWLKYASKNRDKLVMEEEKPIGTTAKDSESRLFEADLRSVGSIKDCGVSDLDESGNSPAAAPRQSSSCLPLDTDSAFSTAMTKACKRFKEHLKTVQETYIRENLDQRLCALRQAIFSAEYHHMERVLCFLEKEKSEKKQNEIEQRGGSSVVPQEGQKFIKEQEHQSMATNKNDSDPLQNTRNLSDISARRSCKEKKLSKNGLLSNDPLTLFARNDEEEKEKESLYELTNPPDIGTKGVGRDSISRACLYISTEGHRIITNLNTSNHPAQNFNNTCATHPVPVNALHVSDSNKKKETKEEIPASSSSLGANIEKIFSSTPCEPRSCSSFLPNGIRDGLVKLRGAEKESENNTPDKEVEEIAPLPACATSSILGISANGYVVSLVPLSTANCHTNNSSTICQPKNVKKENSVPASGSKPATFFPATEVYSHWTAADLARGSAIVEPGFSHRIHCLRSKRRQVEKKLLSVLAPFITEIINLYLAFLYSSLPSLRHYMREGVGEMLDALQVSSLVIEEAHQQLRKNPSHGFHNKKYADSIARFLNDGAPPSPYPSSTSSNSSGNVRHMLPGACKDHINREGHLFRRSGNNGITGAGYHLDSLSSSSPPGEEMAGDRSSSVSSSCSTSFSRSSFSFCLSSLPSSSTASSPSTVSPVLSKRRGTSHRGSFSSSSFPRPPGHHRYVSLSSLRYGASRSPSLHSHHQRPEQPLTPLNRLQRRSSPCYRRSSVRSVRSLGVLSPKRALETPHLTSPSLFFTYTSQKSKKGDGSEVEEKQQGQSRKPHSRAGRDLIPVIKAIETSSSLLHIASTPRLRDFVVALRASICEDTVRGIVKVQQYRLKHLEHQQRDKIALKILAKMEQEKKGAIQKKEIREEDLPVDKILSSSECRPTGAMATTGGAGSNTVKVSGSPDMDPFYSSRDLRTPNDCISPNCHNTNAVEVSDSVGFSNVGNVPQKCKGSKPSSKDSYAISQTSVNTEEEEEEDGEDEINKEGLKKNIENEEKESGSVKLKNRKRMELGSFTLPGIVFASSSLPSSAGAENENYMEGKRSPTVLNHSSSNRIVSGKYTESDFFSRKKSERGKKGKLQQQGGKTIFSPSQSLCFISSSLASPLSPTYSVGKRDGDNDEGSNFPQKEEITRTGYEDRRAGESVTASRYVVNEKVEGKPLKRSGLHAPSHSLQEECAPSATKDAVRGLSSHFPVVSTSYTEDQRKRIPLLLPSSMCSKEEKENREPEVTCSPRVHLPAYGLANRTQAVLAPWASAMPPPPPRPSLRAKHLRLLSSFIRGEHTGVPQCHYHLHLHATPYRRCASKLSHRTHPRRRRRSSTLKGSISSIPSCFTCRSSAGSEGFRVKGQNEINSDKEQSQKEQIKCRQLKERDRSPSLNAKPGKGSLPSRRLLPLSTALPPSSTPTVGRDEVRAIDKRRGSTRDGIFLNSLDFSSPEAATIEAAPPKERKIRVSSFAQLEVCKHSIIEQEYPGRLRQLAEETSPKVGIKQLKDPDKNMERHNGEDEKQHRKKIKKTCEAISIGASSDVSPSRRAGERSERVRDHYQASEEKNTALQKKTERGEGEDNGNPISIFPSPSCLSLSPTSISSCPTPTAQGGCVGLNNNSYHVTTPSPSGKSSQIWSSGRRSHHLLAWRRNVPRVYRPRRNFLVQPSLWILLDVIDEALLFSPFTPWLEVEMQVYKDRVETGMTQVQTKVAETISKVCNAIKSEEHSLHMLEKKIEALTAQGPSSLSNELERILTAAARTSLSVHTGRNEKYEQLYKHFRSEHK